MSEYKSIHVNVGDGVNTRWNTNFAGGFISPDHIFYELDGVTAPVVMDGQVAVIEPPVPSGISFKIIRKTPSDGPLVDWTNGADINEGNLDTTSRQAVFVSAESADDGRDLRDRTLQVPPGEVAPPVGSLVGANGKALGVVAGRIVPIPSTVAQTQVQLDALNAMIPTISNIRDEARAAADSAEDTAATAVTETGLISDTARAHEITAAAARDAAIEAKDAVDTRLSLMEDAAGATPVPTWAELAASTGHAAGATFVVFEDAGTHVDPVTAATVSNAGMYIFRDPAGFERFADASEAARQAIRAEAAATAAASSVSSVQPVVPLVITDTSQQLTRHQTSLDTPGTLTPTTGSGTVVLDASPVAADCKTLLVDIIAAGPGTFYVFSHYKAGDAFTKIDMVPITVPKAGRQNFVVPLNMPAGSYIGFSAPGVTQTMTGGTVRPVYSGGSIANPNFTDASSATSNKFAVRMVAFSGQTRVDILADKLGNTIPVGSLKTVGSTDFSAPMGAPTEKFYRVYNQFFPNGGYIKSVSIFMDHKGTPKVYSYGGETPGTWTPHATKNLPELEAGQHNNVPVGILIPPGGYVGVYGEGISLQSGQWSVGVWLGDTPSFTNTMAPGGNKLLIGWEVLEFEKGDFGVLKAVLSDNAETTSAPSSASGYVPSLHADLLASGARIYAGFQGQSNIVGAPSADADTQATKRQEHGLLTFNCRSNQTQLVAAIPKNTTNDADGREFPGLGGGTYLRQRIMQGGGRSNIDRKRPMIVGHSGDGGTAINRHVKNSTVAGEKFYATSQSQLVAAKNSAGSEGFFHIGQAFWQGNGDALLGTTRTSYKASLASIGKDYDADSRKVTTKGFAVRRTAVMQLASDGTNASWEIAMAQFEACRDEDTLCMACPPYMLDYEDDKHATPASSRLAGAYLMRALSTGRKFEPLQVVDSYTNGTSIHLVYNRPDILLDTDLIPKQTNCGFRVFNSFGGEVSDFTVTVEGNEVILDVGLSVTGYRWSYGNVTAIGNGAYTGGAGNLRDCAGDGDKFDGKPLHNWAVFQEGSL